VVKKIDSRKFLCSKIFFLYFSNSAFINVEQLAGTQWGHIIATLSPLIFEPFIVKDYRCDEFDAIVSSNDNADADQYTQILLYLDRCHRYISTFYVASVIRARARHATTVAPVQGIESSFCLALRKHPWIPVAGGQLFKSTDVYFLPLNNPFRRYVPCLDQSKIPLKDPNFISLLGLKQEIHPMTIFELLMKWSCNLDSDSLKKLINDQTFNV
jgi:hypothetical protein